MTLVELRDEQILLRLRNFEDNFVERKTSSDKRNWLDTTVGFANSLPEDQPGILFIGAKNDGTIEKELNLESLQKTYSQIVNSAYPPIYYLPRVLSEGGRQFLAVLVPGSPHRPHFAGKSYVRVGPETKEASEQQYINLIASRNSKTREILKYRGQQILVDFLRTEHVHMMGAVSHSWDTAELSDCNQFYVTLKSNANLAAFPLSRVDISFDHPKNRLKLEIYPLARSPQ
jgi:predicted HTH transcriptional regulator